MRVYGAGNVTVGEGLTLDEATDLRDLRNNLRSMPYGGMGERALIRLAGEGSHMVQPGDNVRQHLTRKPVAAPYVRRMPRQGYGVQVANWLREQPDLSRAKRADCERDLGRAVGETYWYLVRDLVRREKPMMRKTDGC